jgi:predicted nuclease of restriction endonuclease-like (RecB) superfamily
MNNLENNQAHSHFLKSFLERNVRDVRKTLKQREDDLQLALEIKSALKKERKPKDASNEMSIEIYKKSIMKLDFVLDWLDIQLSELENN